MTDDLTTPEKPAPPDLTDDGADDEALPDVKNDPVPEPAREDDPSTSPEAT
jgi:hypothetical protein